MSLTEATYTINQGQVFTETIELRGEDDALLAEGEVSSLKVSIRRTRNRNTAALYTKTLSRSGDGYPFTLSSEETTALANGTYFGDVYLALSSGEVADYALRLVLNINPTTTAP